MMMNKRLIGMVPESRKYVAGCVAIQWANLIVNIAAMTAAARTLAALYARTLTAQGAAVTALVLLALAAYATVGVLLPMIASKKSGQDGADLEAACKKASVHDFILSLPQGYDTPVGELGDTLSGGEKQRLGLARAFLHDAPLMLLDEPTSNLDSLNEAVILRALRREKDKRAIVLVSHRPSTMATADKVYTAEQGRVS